MDDANDDDDDDDADSPGADDASFLNDVIASSGEVLQPEPRAVFSKIVNPNYMSMLHLRDNGYNFVRYTAKGGKPLEFDIMEKNDWKTFKGLIANPDSGATWKALYYVAPTEKKHKKKNSGKSYANGFTTGSDEEDDAAGADVGGPEKPSSEKLTRKKKGSNAETSPKKSPAKANFPKKQAGCTPKTNDKMKGTDAKKRLEIAAPHPPRLHP